MNGWLAVATTGPGPYVAGGLTVSGVAVGLSRRRELVQRWLVWVCAAILVATASELGGKGLLLLAAGLTVPCVQEYARLVRMPPVDMWFLAVGVLLIELGAGAAQIWLAGPIPLQHWAFGLPLFASLPAVLEGDVRQGGRRAAYLTFGLLWIGALAGLVSLGPQSLALVVAVSVADVGAWCAGKAFGGAALSPLSPGKRMSGMIGGAACGIVVLIPLGASSPGFVVAVAVAAPLGDLAESMLKREAGAKDAGGWLPGFGGMLDRVDSLLFALAVAMVLS